MMENTVQPRIFVLLKVKRGMKEENYFIEFTGGFLGGVAATFTGHPLDTIKIRLQTQTKNNVRFETYLGMIVAYNLRKLNFKISKWVRLFYQNFTRRTSSWIIQRKR